MSYYVPYVRGPLITDAESLRAALKLGWEAQFVFFWAHTSASQDIGPHVLSQWWPSTFDVEGRNYASAEQFMMSEKARLFGDVDTHRRILASDDPREAKMLGRGIAGFSEPLWEAHRVAIVVRGNLAKFGQSPELRRYLAKTEEAVLVEASPFDAIWGIGLASDHAHAAQPDRWPGLNLLGFALMEVRRQLA